ncbi:MAG: hypothetical protein RQ783_10195, partial [Gammaproteobacteria bacterium]|nr:hypothetical protein [Gammaproteobacteria bacterium]
FILVDLSASIGYSNEFPNIYTTSGAVVEIALAVLSPGQINPTINWTAPQPATSLDISQPQAAWDAGTSTVESVISPAKLEAKILNDFNVTGTAPLYACRAWVNFNGTGTVAIRASGNVSSITDNGAGNYTVNFTNAMPDAKYMTTGITSSSGSKILEKTSGAATVSSVDVVARESQTG